MSLFDERVEAAAREIWKADNTTLGIDPPESMEAWVEETEGYLDLARAALVAADAVVTEEMIARWYCEYESVCSAAFDEDDPCYKHRAACLSFAEELLALLRGGAK